MYILNNFRHSKHFFNNLKFFICLTILCLQFPSFQHTVYAQNLPCQTAEVSGHYRHPRTGIIEDSGGDSSEALGQSMVSNVVASQALVETTKNNTYLISLRFKLMNSLSDIKLSFQPQSSDSWTNISYEQTAKGDDTGDLRFEVSDTNIIIKAECMVDAMGRYVIFYITLNNFTDGNIADFIQTPITDDSNIENGTAEIYDIENEAADSTSDEVLSDVTTVSVNELLQSEEGLTISDSATQASTKTAIITEESVAQSDSTTINSEALVELNISAQVWFMLFVIMLCANILGGLCLWGIKAIIKYFSANNKTNSTLASDFADEKDLAVSTNSNDSIQADNNDICNIDNINLMKGLIYDENED